ncbi:hypothetical protein BKE56_022545 [Rhodococcus sp. M8]|nr:hypothetical protein BKE56_022545 [Rhodococcus sp. M8]
MQLWPYDVEADRQQLRALQQHLADVCRRPVEEIAENMRAHRILTAEQARDYGLIDAVGGNRTPPRRDRRVTRRSAEEHRDPIREIEQRLREDAEHHRHHRPGGDRDGCQHTGHHDRRGVAVRLVEEHQHDDAHVEVRRNRAADHADDHEWNGSAARRRPEHGELADEPARERDAGEREEEQGEDRADEG